MFSTANYTSIPNVVKTKIQGLYFLGKPMYILLVEMSLFWHLHFFTSLFGAKVQLTSSPFYKTLSVNIENPSPKLIVGEIGRAYGDMQRRRMPIKFHQFHHFHPSVFPYRKKRLYILFRFFIVVDFYGGIGGIHLYHNKRIHKLTFLWRFHPPNAWWINGGIHQNVTHCDTSTHKDVPKWDKMSHLAHSKLLGMTCAIQIS